MSALRILVFGSSEDLASPAAEKVKHYFAGLPADANFELVTLDKVPPPTRKPQGGFHGAIWVWHRAEAEHFMAWQGWLRALKTPLRVVAYSETPVPSELREMISPVEVVSASQGIDAVMAHLESEPGLKDAPNLDLSLIMTNAIELSAELPAAVPVEDFGLEAALSGLVDDAEPIKVFGGHEPAPTPLPDAAPESLSLEGAFDGASSLELAAGTNFNAAPAAASDDDVYSQLVRETPPVAGEGSVANAKVDDIWSVAGASAAEPSVGMISDAMSIQTSVEPAAMERGPVATTPPVNSQEFQTLQRYSALKEREAREKEATIQVANKQLEQLRERLAKSEAERRRLTMELTEAETLRRSLEDERDQTKHHLNKAEAAQQEEIRAFQIRLDNTQFQATRAEKKLDEFRERVRADIQKIRLRERELSNRLELQKRDAEALLGAKDERLLQQKREIDRLEFEVETLRERLVDSTQKAEDRVARVARALRALKMANGMLSGIEDEVLPNVEEKSDDGEEAA